MDKKKLLKTSKELSVVSTLFILSLAIFFYDICFLGKTLRVTDTISTIYNSGQFNTLRKDSPKYIPVYDNTPAVLEEPYFEFKKKAIMAGSIPLWNPHQAGGYPFLATLESSLFFIPEIVLYAIPSPYQWDIYLLFRLFLAGIFTYSFMRVLQFSFLPSFAAALSYMFSGPVITWIENVTLNSDLLLPLFLLTIELILQKKEKRYVFFSSFVLFQGVAGGHPEHAFFLVFTGLLYFSLRILLKCFSYPLNKVCINFFLALVIGFCLSTPLILPFVEYAFFNAWHIHNTAIGLGTSSLNKAITLLFPWFYSKELVSYEGWVSNTWEGGWIGFITVWFFFIAISKKTKTGFIFFIICSLYLLKTYGVIPFQWIGYLPVFNQLKFYLHVPQNIAFAFAVLNGIAIAHILSGTKYFKQLIISFLGLLFFSAYIFFFTQPVSSFFDILSLPLALGFFLSFIAWLGFLGYISKEKVACFAIVVLSIELFSFIPRERDKRTDFFQSVPYIDFLRKSNSEPFRVFGFNGSLSPNTATAYGIDDAGLYEGLFVKRFSTYIRELVDSSFFTENSFHAFRGKVGYPANRFLDLLNVKYFILPSYPPPNIGQVEQFSMKPIYNDDVLILERLNVFPRAMLRYSVNIVSDDVQALKILKANYPLTEKVLLNKLPEGRQNPSETVPIFNTSVTTGKYGINKKTFVVSTPQDGFLVLNDVNYPGWSATVQGHTEEIVTANYLFQAVFVPKGKSIVEFSFFPLSLKVGLTIAGLTLVLILIWISLDQYKMSLKRGDLLYN